MKGFQEVARRGCAISIAAFAFATAAAAQSPAPPPTEAIDAVTTLHGVTISDPYQWLEDAASPATRSWIGGQQQYTAALLSSRPGMDSLRSQVRELVDHQITQHLGALKQQARVQADRAAS